MDRPVVRLDRPAVGGRRAPLVTGLVGVTVVALLIGLFVRGAPREDPAPRAPAAPPPAAPSPLAELHAPGDVIAVGDLHSDPDAALAALHMAGLVDERGKWVGGTTWLVQTGDVLDRGPDSRGMLDMLRRLEIEARTAGGRVVVLDGNHEVMNLTGDWRYVSEPDLAGYGGEAARKAAFLPSGPDGKWVIDHDIAVQIDGTVFVHGGIDERWAAYGVRGLVAMARAAMTGDGPKDVLGPDGPLWNRVYLQSEDPVTCPILERALAKLGARRMVVGHTVQESGQIADRCGGRLYGIDTGVSAHYGRHLSALRIPAGGGTPRPVYPPTPSP